MNLLIWIYRSIYNIILIYVNINSIYGIDIASNSIYLLYLFVLINLNYSYVL